MQSAAAASTLLFHHYVDCVATSPAPDSCRALLSLSTLTGERWGGELYLVDTESHTARSLCRSAHGLSSVCWSGPNVAVAASDSGDIEIYAVGSEQKNEEESGGDDQQQNGGDRSDSPADSGRHVSSIVAHDDVVSGVAALSEAEVISVSYDTHVRSWDVNKGVRVSSREAHCAPLDAVSSSGDGKRFASVSSRERTVHVWSSDAANATATLRTEVECFSAALNEDASQIAVGLANGSVEVYDARNLEQALVKRTLHRGVVRVVAFGGEGERLVASGGDDKQVAVWSVEGKEGKEEAEGAVYTSRAHKDFVRGLDFVESQQLLSAGWDKTARFHQLSAQAEK